MKRPDLTHAERVAIVEQHLAGVSLAAIAAQLALNVFTVRHWWRTYRDGGWAALAPVAKGPPRCGVLGRFDPRVKYVALRLKREHPGWGPPMLRLHLQRRPSWAGLALPKPPALWAYWHQFGGRLFRPRRLATHRPAAAPLRAEAVHQCWELDFKGDERVAGGPLVVCPWSLIDAASGAPLLRLIHTIQVCGHHRGLTSRLVQADLRQAFAQWGWPEALRMDRDARFIGSARFDWPGTRLLWLVGLGIPPLINRAYRPTDNALIERAHPTWSRDGLWGQSFSAVAPLQAASDQALLDRRRSLPSRHPGCEGQAPEVAFPERVCARRLYQCEHEAELFDLARVDAYLASWEWRRLVDCEGKISLANRNHRLHRRYRGQVVKVQFEPATRQFVWALASDEIVARLTLVEVTAEYICGQGVGLKRTIRGVAPGECNRGDVPPDGGAGGQLAPCKQTSWGAGGQVASCKQTMIGCRGRRAPPQRQGIQGPC